MKHGVQGLCAGPSPDTTCSVARDEGRYANFAQYSARVYIIGYYVRSCGEGISMKQIRMLAQYYVDLMMKLGLVRLCGVGIGGAGDCRADGGDDHGAAWSG